MPTQYEKAIRFQQLHTRPGAFLIPNPWDRGSARALEINGFEALASTSAGFAFSRGEPDNGLGLDQMLVHLADIVEATSLPVSADLENCYADEPELAAKAISLAAEAGVVGASIEDSRNDGSGQVYEFELAVDRVRAAAEAARKLPFPFMLTARAENFIVGNPDLADTIRRLQAFQEAGADVLYAPGLRNLDEIATVVRAVDLPVNVIMAAPGLGITMQQLAEAGVKRVSVGGALARAAWGGFLEAVRELKENGSFSYNDRAVSGKAMQALLKR